ncbi:MAG: hypothetical protein WC438_00005 [Candidatus Pacearchaeota archaeon]
MSVSEELGYDLKAHLEYLARGCQPLVSENEGDTQRLRSACELSLGLRKFVKNMNTVLEEIEQSPNPLVSLKTTIWIMEKKLNGLYLESHLENNINFREYTE